MTAIQTSREVAPSTPKRKRPVPNDSEYEASDSTSEDDDDGSDSDDAPSPPPKKKPRTPRTPDNRHESSPAQPPPDTPATPPTTPKKKGGATPGRPKSVRGPTKASLRKAASEKKKQWKKDWENFCMQNKWIKDDDYKQMVWAEEMHGSKGARATPSSSMSAPHRLTTHGTTSARSYFCLKEPWELDPLPYWEFPNEHNGEQPGRSYRYLYLLRHVYRKFGYLNGIHEDPEKSLLEEGKKFFDEQCVICFSCARTNAHAFVAWRSSRGGLLPRERSGKAPMSSMCGPVGSRSPQNQSPNSIMMETGNNTNPNNTNPNDNPSRPLPMHTT